MVRMGWALSAMLLGTALGLAAPPALEIPAEVRPAGEYVRFSPKTDALGVTYIGLSGLDPFPSEELKDAKRFLLHTRGVADGRYKFAAIGASATGEQTRVDFVVIVGDPANPKPPVPDPNKPVPVPVPDPSTLLTAPVYVIIVEESRNRTPAQGKVIVDTAAALTAAGQKFKLLDRNDPLVMSLALDKIADATGLPAVVVRDAKGVDRGFKLPGSAADLQTTVKGLVKP